MPNPSESKPKQDPTGKRIIVIDDEPELMEMFTMCLRGEGFLVQPARDGRGILKRTAKFPPDLVISDVMMPGGGGYDVLRTLQGDPSTRDVPVLVMSGFSFDPSTKDMLMGEPNVKAFLKKPVRPDVMITQVHEILGTISKEEKAMEEQRKKQAKDFGNADLGRYDF